MAERVNPILEQITQQSTVARSKSVDFGLVEQSNAVKSETILAELERDQTKIGENQALVVRAQLTGQLQAQQIQQKAIDAAGGYDTLLALIGQTAQTAQKVSADVQQLTKEKTTRLVDDPLEWIKAQVDWNGTQKKVEAGVTELQVVSGAAQNLESRLTQVGQISKSMAQTITQASIEASADTVSKEAAIQAGRFRLEGLKANTAGIKAIAEMEDRELDSLYKEGAFRRGEEQFDLALREEERRRAEFKERIDLAKEAQIEKLDARQMEERTIYFINLGEAARGQTPSTALEIRDHIRLNKGIGPEYAELYENGKIADKGGPNLISTSPGRTASVLARDPTLVANLPEQQKKVAELVLSARAALGQVKDPATLEALGKDKTGAAAAKIISEGVQTQVARQLSYVGNNPDNLFYIGDLSSYIGTSQSPGVAAFQKYPLTQQILNPAIKTGTSLADAGTVFGLAVAGVQANKIPLTQAAADLSQIYKRASALHRASADFRKFGITLPADGATYRVKINGEIVDLTKWQDVARAMNNQMAREAMNKAPNQRGGSMSPAQRF